MSLYQEKLEEAKWHYAIAEGFDSPIWRLRHDLVWRWYARTSGSMQWEGVARG